MKHAYPEWLNRNVLGFSLASLMSDASHEVVPLMLPLLISQLMGTEQAPFYVALISGAATSVASIVGLYAGIASDSYPRKPIILIGYFLAGTLTGALACANHWLGVFLLILGIWIGRGLVSAPRSALLSETTAPKYYGRVFGFRQAFDTIGSVIGPAMVYLLTGWSVRCLFLYTLIPGIGAFLLTLLAIQEPSRNPTDNHLRNFSLVPQKMSQAFYTLAAIFLLFGLASFNKTMVVLRIQEILNPSSSSLVVFGNITLLYLFRNIVQTGASYYVGALSDRIGRIVPLGLFGFAFFGLMSLLLAIPNISLPLAILIFFLSGVSAGTTMSLQKALVADLLPENLRGTGYGLLATITTLGSLLSSLTIGFIWNYAGAQIAFLMAACISFLTIAALPKVRAIK